MQIDLQLKINAPEWAKYSAIDENGDFCVFDEKPFICDEIVGEGIFDTNHNYMLLAKNCIVSDWKESLTEIV